MRARAGLQRAAVERDALAHAQEPEAVAGPARPGCPRAAPVVGDLEAERARVAADGHPRVVRAGVLGRVRERLLHDAERCQIDAGRQRLVARADVERDLQARRPRPGGELADVGQAGPGPLLVGCAQPGQLGERLGRQALDQLEAVRRAARVALRQRLGPAGLDRDHADVVRDGVVQVAGDARPLAGHGRAGVAGAGALDLRAAPAPRPVSARLPRTTRPTVHGRATPPSSAAIRPSG